MFAHSCLTFDSLATKDTILEVVTVEECEVLEID